MNLTAANDLEDRKRLLDRATYYERLAENIPQPLPPIIEWAEANVHLNGAQGEMYLCSNTPWTRLPIELCENPNIREVTFVKPIRTGGSAAGHVVLCRWILTAQGQIQYNWPTDIKAEDMWDKEIDPILKKCPPVHRKIPSGGSDRFKARKGLIVFPNCSLTVQGVFATGALDSDTVPFQINEEIHAWEHGHLAKAYGRGSGCDFPIRFNISNAGIEGDQLHAKFKAGTMRQWEVKCPGCKLYHVMRVRWDERHPECGGLWYDYEKARRADGIYNYNEVARTIVYRMPCGFMVHDDINERRALSVGGRYSAPFNTGARSGAESMTYQAVSSHKMDWVAIVERRNEALLARRIGDEESYKKYVQEVECEFYSPDKLPFQGQIVLSKGVVKSREGLPGELCKMWAADWQQGYKELGELTHYWLVIESVLPNCNSQVLFGGVVSDEQELLLTLKEHGITDEDRGGLFDGFVDASKNQKQILSFCYRYGINAVVGGDRGKGGWRWPDGSFRFYSPKKFIYTQLGITFERAQAEHPDWFSLTREGLRENDNCPYIVEYDKGGLLKNHFFIKEMKAKVLGDNPKALPAEYIERVVPEDIGDDYLHHHEAWERDLKAQRPKKMGAVEGFRQITRRDHLMSCTTYIDLYKEFSGLLGERLATMGMVKKAEG